MDIWVIVLRTIFVYFIMVVVVHAFGKKEVAKLPLLTILVGFMIAQLAVSSIVNVEQPMLANLLPIGILIFAQVCYLYLSSKSKEWRKTVKGKHRHEQENWTQTKQANSSAVHFPLVLIKDGMLLHENIAKLGKHDFWLKAELKKRIGLTNFKYISFCSIDGFGHWYIDVKDYLPQK